MFNFEKTEKTRHGQTKILYFLDFLIFCISVFAQERREAELIPIRLEEKH
jgi:hypothetical protein